MAVVGYGSEVSDPRFAAPTGKAVWLRCVWISDAKDPSDVACFPLMSSLSVTPTVNGEVREFAGGVDIAFSRPGKRSPWRVDLPHCTREQLRWLEDHIGRDVCLRDDRGRKMFGIYWSVPIDEDPHSPQGATQLDVRQVSYVEAV